MRGRQAYSGWAACCALLLAAGAAIAQEGEGQVPKAAPISIYASEATLRQHIGEVVVVRGVTGALNADPATNAAVYRLTDDYNHSVWVRCALDRKPSLHHTYAITGTVVQKSDGTFELIEDVGQRVDLNPTNSGGGGDGGGKASDDGQQPAEKEGLSQRDKLLIAGGSLIVLALVVLGVLLRQQAVARAREQALAQQQAQQQMMQRQAELERQLAMGAAGGAAAGGRPPTVLADGAAPGGANGPAQRPTTVMSLGKLEARQGPFVGQTFPLASTVNVVGRGEGEVRLDKDETVSGRHASIVFTNDGQVTFTDHSRNGSRLNGETVHQNAHQPRPLKTGDTIEIGASTFEFVAFRTAGAAPAEPGDGAQRRAATVMAAAPGAAGAAAPAVDASRAPTGMFLGAELEAVRGPDQGTHWPLEKALVTLGRMDDQDLRLQDATVSRQHATLLFQDGQFILSNVSSRGTRVNGAAIEKATLNDGDEIELGGTVLRFRQLTPGGAAR